MKIIDNQIKAFVAQKYETTAQSNPDQIVSITKIDAHWYQLHCTSEKHQFTMAVTNNVTSTLPNLPIRIITYYKNRRKKLHNLYIRNKLQ